MNFLIDWQFKNYFVDIKSRKSSSKILLFSKSFQYPYRFQYQSKITFVIQIKKRRINFLFIAVIYFPLSIQMNILTLYNNCYVILTTYMLDSALEPSYNLSKNLLLLSWILKLIVDMVNDSTPLLILYFFNITKEKYLYSFSPGHGRRQCELWPASQTWTVAPSGR